VVFSPTSGVIRAYIKAEGAKHGETLTAEFAGIFTFLAPLIEFVVMTAALWVL
jgi:hypothetical protein